MSIHFLKLDRPVADQAWRKGLGPNDPSVHADCVAAVPGVEMLVEQGQVVPSAYQGRTIDIVVAPGVVYAVTEEIYRMVLALLGYHRDIKLPALRDKQVIPVPGVPGHGIERGMQEFADLRRATHEAVQTIAGAPFYPYCGSEAATAAADQYDLRVMIAAKVAKRCNDKAYLESLRKRDERLATLIPDSVPAGNDAESIMKKFDRDFLKQGRKAMIKCRFGASGMNLKKLDNMEDLESFLREPDTQDVLSDPENGFVFQELVDDVSESPSLNAWIGDDGEIKIFGFTLQDLKGGMIHVGNKNCTNLFNVFPGLYEQVKCLLNELYKDGARGAVGFDFVLGKDKAGKPTCKLIEINMRHLGATRGPVRAHDFRVARENKAPHPWWIGYVQMKPGIGINEVLSILERNIGRPLFDPITRTGVMVTMIAPDGRVHLDVHARTARERDEWVATIKAI